MNVLRKHGPVLPMTVAEFMGWDSGDRSGALWQLRDGEPEMMAPASDRHGAIQSMLAHLLTAHLLQRGGAGRAVTNPGVAPKARAKWNARIPDIGVTCAPPGEHMLPDPVLLIGILSPRSPKETWSNVWTYTTLPSVTEILVVHSTEIRAELLRRPPDGAWPDNPAVLTAEDTLELGSVGVAAPLREAYRTSGLE